MTYRFEPMTGPLARQIVDTWKYGGIYSVYDYTNEEEHMLDTQAWGTGIFAVLDDEGTLTGELSLEFWDDDGNYTEYSDFSNQEIIQSRELWIGFGMRPDLTGRGGGADFVEACTDFAVSRYRYRGDYVRLGVALFNKRALRAYEKAGFSIFKQVRDELGGIMTDCVYMQKPLK